MKNTVSEFKTKIEVLTPENKQLISMFDSGVFAFNEYINSSAIQDMGNGDGVTYLIENIKSEDNIEIVAYYTISSASIINIYIDEENCESSEREKYFLPISSFMINMFAVNKKYQDCYFKDKLISSLVLKYIIGTLYEMSINIIAAKMIILCSVPDAVKFYEKNNFKKIDECYTIFDKVDAMDNIPMYLTLHV